MVFTLHPTRVAILRSGKPSSWSSIIRSRSPVVTDDIELADVSEAFSMRLRKSQMLRKTLDAVYQKGKLLAFIARI
ncbi:hypothetical protein TNCV_4627531 [Trichonephila clavipes]|nr:hypothetical protein TNCV_4627531 [Trichonephila clavipes]